MQKRDVVKKAIAHRETDEIPYCIQFSKEAAELIRPFFPGGDLDLAIGNYIYWFNPPWWDWVNLPPAYAGYDAPGCFPQTKGCGSYEAFYGRCRHIRETTDCYVLINIDATHFEKAYFARGIDNCLADFIANPQFAKDFFDKIIQKNMTMLENIVSCPDVDGVMLGSDWGSQKSLFMSPDIWREFIKPGELREYRLLKESGKDVWIHSCGNIRDIIPDLAEMGVDVLNPLQPECMDIFEIKRSYGDRIAFWGGISTQQTLPYGSPEDVRRETEKVMRGMGRGGGYIAAPSQEIQDDVPVQNVLAMLSEFNRKR